MWTALVHSIQGLMASVAGSAGGSLALGILFTVLAIRLLLIPILLPLAARTRDRNAIARRLQPELAAIKQEFKKDPMREQKEISELHKRHGISLVDGPGLFGALIQLPVLIALFQAVYHITRDTTLAAPAIVVGLIASALAVGGLWLNGQGDSKAMLVLFGALPLVMAIWLGQGIGLYLIALNAATALQGMLLRRWPNTIEPFVQGIQAK